MNEEREYTLVHIVTVPLSLRFFEGQIAYMQENGFQIHVISSPGSLLDEFAFDQKVTASSIEMQRKITPLKDLVAVWRIWRVLRHIKPDIVHAHTPKGGLLGMIAARLARVPARIYHVRGLPFEASTGNRRRLLKLTEQISCGLAHRVFCNSQSNLNVIVKEKMCKPDKITMLHKGSGNGVDATRLFNPGDVSNAKNDIRSQYGLPIDSLVIGFVGRIVHDKGVDELIEAWQSLRDEYPDVHLLFVGRFESQNAVSEETKSRMIKDTRIHLAEFVEKKSMPQLYSAMDIVVLPSHREGFPNVLLEAAAMGLPVISTLASGCVDAVIDRKTGILVPINDASALAEAIQSYLDNPELRQQHGQAGRERVLRDFCPEDIWKAQLNEYHQLLDRNR